MALLIVVRLATVMESLESLLMAFILLKGVSKISGHTARVQWLATLSLFYYRHFLYITFSFTALIKICKHFGSGRVFLSSEAFR